MRIAKEYFDSDREFYSKTKRGVYKIKYVSKDKVVIKKLRGKNDEVVGKKLFLNNFENLKEGKEWNCVPAVRAFLMLHPKIKEKDGVLVYEE
ncbi:hypothetical protein [Methanotorris igneus]|uniref:hypothetical protein n=1 Tax=Methanotorris igneus TaxID=2189 RepID=UPI002ADE3196|nr:hypothetical protein [Methanotorris igneus]